MSFCCVFVGLNCDEMYRVAAGSGVTLSRLDAIQASASGVVASMWCCVCCIICWWVLAVCVILFYHSQAYQ